MGQETTLQVGQYHCSIRQTPYPRRWGALPSTFFVAAGSVNLQSARAIRRNIQKMLPLAICGDDILEEATDSCLLKYVTLCPTCRAFLIFFSVSHQAFWSLGGCLGQAHKKHPGVLNAGVAI